MREFLHRTSIFSSISYNYFFVGLEVLTVVVINGYEKLNNSLFWHVTLYGPLIVNSRFGRTWCRHLQGQRISQAGGKQNLLFASHWYLAWLLL
jgi:hypothetical protein